MYAILIGIFARIISNSYLNVYQKLLTSKGNKPSTVNFYTYFILSICSVLFFFFYKLSFSGELLFVSLAIGLMGTLGNYFIIKALSLGELSSLAPINSYKPIIAMIIAFFYLKEIPSLFALTGIILIIAGTYILFEGKFSNKKALFYRFLALIFSGSEAVFIKKAIVLTNIPISFAIWSVSGMFFAFLLMLFLRQCFKITETKNLFILVIFVALMQYSTNFVFSKINVSYALALFQLSTLLSVLLGIHLFKENELKRKLIASFIMILGAVIIILGK